MIRQLFDTVKNFFKHWRFTKDIQTTSTAEHHKPRPADDYAEPLSKRRKPRNLYTLKKSRRKMAKRSRRINRLWRQFS